MNQVNILGVEISDISKSAALAKVQNFVEDRFQHYITTPNPEIALASQKDKNLRLILNHADLALPDGFGLKIAAKILGEKLRYRVSGADFMEAIVSLAESVGWPIFLLGGKDEKIAEKAAWRLRYLFKNVRVSGHASGGEVSFNEGRWQASDKKLIDKINNSGAKIIFVGFGCPKQEKWIFTNLDKLSNIKVAMTVGGALDYLSGAKHRAPVILRKIGLEWLWRLALEPKRFKRVWNATFRFILETVKWKTRILTKYRKNALACIINDSNEVLLVHRSNEKNEHWQFPQGGVEEGEAEEDAVMREMREEVGLKKLEIVGVHPEYHQYEWPRWHKLHGGYRGQRQAIFYLRQIEEEAIKLDLNEIDEYKWVSLDKVVDKVHEQRRDVAEMVVEGYRKITSS